MAENRVTQGSLEASQLGRMGLRVQLEHWGDNAIESLDFSLKVMSECGYGTDKIAQGRGQKAKRGRRSGQEESIRKVREETNERVVSWIRGNKCFESREKLAPAIVTPQLDEN